MRRWVVLGLGLIAVTLAGCGGGSGFVDGTVLNSVAGTMHVGMAESAAKSGLHGAPLDILHLPGSGECLYYRGINKRSSTVFYATGNEWEVCFQNNKVVLLLRTCGVGWKLNELDRYKKAGYKYNMSRFHGNTSDCHH